MQLDRYLNTHCAGLSNHKEAWLCLLTISDRLLGSRPDSLQPFRGQYREILKVYRSVTV